MWMVKARGKRESVLGMTRGSDNESWTRDISRRESVFLHLISCCRFASPILLCPFFHSYNTFPSYSSTLLTIDLQSASLPLSQLPRVRIHNLVIDLLPMTKRLAPNQSQDIVFPSRISTCDIVIHHLWILCRSLRPVGTIMQDEIVVG